jgi:hypothetical protein
MERRIMNKEVFLKKDGRKESLGIQRCKWNDNNKMDLREDPELLYGHKSLKKSRIGQHGASK